MLKRLKDTGYKIDNNSILTINVDGEIILKISPIEVLVIADEIVRQQQGSIRLQVADNIYKQTLEALGITKEIEDRIRNNESKEEYVLIEFVRYMLYEEKVNKINKDEIIGFGFDLKTIKDILKKYGYNVDVEGDVLVINNGEN